MSLGDHLAELQSRMLKAVVGLVVAVIITTCFGGYLFKFLCEPYERAMKSVGQEPHFFTTTLPESFLMYCNVTLLFGLILAAPWIFWQLWGFVASGLRAKEKRLVHVLAPLSAILFMIGAMLFIELIAPWTLIFFFKFNVGVDYIQNMSTLQNYLNFMIHCSLVFGLAFQFPLLVVGFNKLGFISVATLNKWRKYMIFAIVVIAGILTPPDVVSQMALAVPLYVLYEISVLYCWLTSKK
jgi:sec-independent protein translocase protein TatC